MGRSRGGLTTKIHAVVDAHGLPILLKLTEGQAHDGKIGEGMLGLLGRDCILLADRGYDSDALRAKVADAGALANIRPLDHRTDPPAFNPLVYKYRNRVERFFSRIKHFRAAATRFAPVPSPYRPIYAGAPCAACTLLELGVDVFAHSGVREPQK